jgi:hypothetical protein
MKVVDFALWLFQAKQIPVRVKTARQNKTQTGVAP